MFSSAWSKMQHRQHSDPDRCHTIFRKPLKLCLDQYVDDGILESVPPDEPVTWCSPVVVQPKPKYFHVPNDEAQTNVIRACIDLGVPNKFMERNRVTQGPVVEECIYNFHDCEVFSKLDLRSGYHQLMLHPTLELLLPLTRHVKLSTKTIDIRC